jgi:hypothetical protein
MGLAWGITALADGEDVVHSTRRVWTKETWMAVTEMRRRRV